MGGAAARQRNSSLLASARQLQAHVRPQLPPRPIAPGEAQRSTHTILHGIRASSSYPYTAHNR
jgi:hypothetical protein